MGGNGGLSLYDIDFEKRYSIDNKYIHFVKVYGFDLTSNSYNPDGSSTYHEYFFIHDDLFDIFLETDQNSDIVIKVINKAFHCHQSMTMVQIKALS